MWGSRPLQFFPIYMAVGHPNESTVYVLYLGIYIRVEASFRYVLVPVHSLIAAGQNNIYETSNQIYDEPQLNVKITAYYKNYN